MRGAQELSLDFSSLNFTQDINLRLLQARLTQFPKQKGGRRSSPLASLANYVSFSSVGFVVTTKYWFEDCHCHSARASFLSANNSLRRNKLGSICICRVFSPYVSLSLRIPLKNVSPLQSPSLHRRRLVGEFHMQNLPFSLVWCIYLNSFSSALSIHFTGVIHYYRSILHDSQKGELVIAKACP